MHKMKDHSKGFFELCAELLEHSEVCEDYVLEINDFSKALHEGLFQYMKKEANSEALSVDEITNEVDGKYVLDGLLLAKYLAYILKRMARELPSMGFNLNLTKKSG